MNKPKKLKKQFSQDKKSFLNKLYLNPIDCINEKFTKAKGFRIKPSLSQVKLTNEGVKQLKESRTMADLGCPNFGNNFPRPKQLMGNVIIQNWETAKKIPKDIGSFLHYPVLIDRKKFSDAEDLNNLISSQNNNKIKTKSFGEKILSNLKTDGLNNLNNLRLTSPTNYYTSQKTNLEQISSYQTDAENNIKFNTIQTSNHEENKQLLMSPQNKNTTLSIPFSPQKDTKKKLSIPKKPILKKKKLIDFRKFNKHLYLRDNDFLYAKRVGGPVDFVLCSYQDINHKAKVASTGPQAQVNAGRKFLPSLSKKKKNSEYITISKNTVLHYQKGIPCVYSIQEWIDNFEKYKQLMTIPLFKNFKNAKLFDLWRRFYKKTKRQYYTEKLKKKFFFIDKYLLEGILETRQSLKQMKFTNIFDLHQSGSVLLNQFNELHKINLIDIDKKIDNFRNKTKSIIASSCNDSYQEYKILKKITLDDNNSAGLSTTTKNDNNKKEKKSIDEGNNIQNFIKDAIPYAQDATRKTHYKKLLRYIRVMDYIFNEAKYSLIEYSLEMLDKKFKRLYECFLNKWVDPPIIVTKILCMGDKIYYNPSIRTVYEAIFDNFIQETIYCVIYKKNFIDPQEFPRYMSCFEEVFEVSVDQNSNLNTRIKESEEISKLFSSIRENFELCHIELDKEVEKLRPILENFLKNDKINFKTLEETATPTELRDLLEEFHEQDAIIKQLKSVINIGIFEFQLEGLLEKVSTAPKTWLEKIGKVIPNVLVDKVRSSINRMSSHLADLSTNPTDVESFIKLKKAVEICNKEKQLHEDTNNDIIDLQNIIDVHKEIKLPEFNAKLLIELKDYSVKYDRKLDSTSYFIDNNIQQFRLDLKNEISKFDEKIKGMMSDLNNSVLNTYNEDTFAAIDILEETSLNIKKCLLAKEKYQQEERDLEIDSSLKSDFENLDNLVYEQKLKEDLWNSIKEFQDKSIDWDREQVLQIDLEKMKQYIKKWLDLCKVAIVDIDIPQVPMQLRTHVQTFEQLIPIIEAIQNPNISNVPMLMGILSELLQTDTKLSDQFLTCSKVRNLPDIFSRLPDIKELNNRANEEKRLKDLIKITSETFYARKIPSKTNYVKKDYDKEFEFVEENLRMLNKVYLNRYCGCVIKDLEKLTTEFQKYQKFLTLYVYYQKYLMNSEGIMECTEFSKDMQTEYRKLLNENLKKSLYQNIKNYPTIQKFLTEHVPEKIVNNINSIIQSYESNYKGITTFFDKKRKEIPKYYLLSNNDINEIYQERESKEIKQKMIYKMFPWIKYINIGEDQDETLNFTTMDREELSIRYTKSSRTLKDLIETLDIFLVKKLKENFKSFKKEYEISLKPKGTKAEKKIIKKPKEVINDLITNKDNLGQGIFNCMFYLTMDNIEKSLFIADEAFDKLFDLYNEIKDDKIKNFIETVKNINTPEIQRRIIINIISLYNYSKIIIESLIREDVTTSSDFNFCKLMNAKIENDTYVIHFLSYSIEYGYEYVGLQDNFMIMPESERMYCALGHVLFSKRPFQIYGNQENGKKEIMKIFANLCGKHILYFNCTKNFCLNAFNNIFLANAKLGCWLCLDQSQNLKFENFEILANRISDIYRYMQSNNDTESLEGEKLTINVGQLNIFLYRDLSYYIPFSKESVPNIIKNYYRHLALPKFNQKLYLDQTLNNLSFEDHEDITNKILYALNFFVCKINVLKSQNLTNGFVFKIAYDIIKNISNIKDLKKYLRNLLKSLYENLVNAEEKEDLRKFLNEIFDMKDYAEDLPTQKNISNENIEKKEEEQKLNSESSDDKILIEAISKELNILKINSEIYANKIKFFYESLKKFNNFVIVGPPICGKSKIVGILHEVSKNLNTINMSKYPKLFNVRLYPKSRTIDEIFSENKIERAYRFNNNYFYNMISLFNTEEEETLIKLNNYHSSLLAYVPPDIEEDLTPEKLKKIFTKDRDDDDYQQDDEVGTTVYQRDKETHFEHNIKIITFDGQIDDTWIEYINNIYDNENFLDLSNGDKINLRDGFKIVCETQNLKNVPPSFLTKQIILSCDYDSYGWDTVLFCWMEANPKIIENNILKNYIRGLFENYFPKVLDFIEHNKIKNITLGANYVMRSLINIFDSIIPMFNFEDVKIGRKKYDVCPKIEIIKKCSLSIFIFSCTWTMNLLSDFVIKTKIEKLISDIFKADDLKGPIFDYYIDERSNDFELWTNILKDPYFNLEQKKGVSFYYDKIFIHNSETIPYFWLCDKLIDLNIPFYFNGKANSGKSFLVNTLMNKKSDEDLEILRIKMVASYFLTPEEIEDFIFKNMYVIKKDLYGDKFIKETCLFIDDLNMNINKDKYGSSTLLEFLRQLTENKYLYDSRNNEIRYLKKFNVCCCGNLSAYPNNDEFNRFIAQYLIITFVTSEDYYLSVFKPTLEFHFRNFIPNTSGITASQYIQACIKLNHLLKKVIIHDPKKMHININIRDVMKVIQGMHDFKFKGDSDYPEYLKKLFFYENSLVYESKFNKKEDIKLFREKICEAYSSVFKQDKVNPADIFKEKWDTSEIFAFCIDYNNFNGDNDNLKKEYCYINKKELLIDYIRSKIEIFYRAKDIKNKTYIKATKENLLTIIRLLRLLQNRNPNLILVGKESTGKKNLFELSCFIAQIDIFEIDNTYSYNTTRTKETFISNIITPFLSNIINRKKKSIIYIPSSVKIKYVLEVINKLCDLREIINNFNTNNDEDILLDEEETYERLSKNLAFCFDIIPNTEQYYNIFTNYPTISNRSSVIYFNSWKNKDMSTYLDTAIKELNIKKDIKPKLSELFIDIYNYTSETYINYSNKIGVDLYLNQKKYSDVCEFYSSKYNIYKTILTERQRKYNEAFKTIDKTKELIERANKEISNLTPARQELDKLVEEKRKLQGEKTREKNNWRAKKQQEEKTISQLDIQKKEKRAILDNALSPFEDAINKTTIVLNKLQLQDVTEMKNTWDNLAFGKFILQKVFELLGEYNIEWDYIKKSLDIKIIKSLISLSPIKYKEKYINITKEITSSPDFSSGDNKYQKPYKVCGYLCDYFNACQKYFNEIDNQKAIINKINSLNEEIYSHKRNIKEFIQKATIVDNELGEIDKIINDIETKKSSNNSHLLKLQALRDCLKQFMESASKKLNIWNKRKESIDIILNNYDFYLMVISSYTIYAPPLSYNYRLKYKNYLYSLSEKLQLENIKKLEIYKIFLEILDIYGKDNEFCSSIGEYDGFIAENLTLMYIMNNKIPYLIDYNGMSPDIISEFLEKKTPKVIVKATYNDIHEQGDMFEKIETSMKNGSILFIEQCGENIYHIMENLILNKFIYNAEKGKNSYVIKNKKMELNPKFKLYLIKSKINQKIFNKAYENLYIINFNCPRKIITNYMYEVICKEQNPEVFQQLIKLKIDINKYEFRLLESEKKILHYNKKMDLTYNLDKLESNQALLEKYNIESSTYIQVNNTINTNKKRLKILTQDLKRFEAISDDGSHLYKICKLFFYFDSLLMIPIDYLSNLIKEFYTKKYGIFKDLLLKKKQKKKETIVEEEEEDEKEENEDDQNNEEKKDDEENEEEKINEELEKQKKEGDDIPTYKKENAPELVIYLYNKISCIYDIHNKKYLLLIFLFFGLKRKDEVPIDFKQILRNVQKIFFKGKLDKTNINNEKKSPISCIDDYKWNCIKQINDNSTYILTIIIDHIENHPSEWETFLEDDELLLSRKFNVFDEDLEAAITPFMKFLFFSIVKTNLADSLIFVVINDIIKSDDNPFISLPAGIEHERKEITFKKQLVLEELFSLNINNTRKPIIIFDKENSGIMLQKEIKEFYIKKLKSSSGGEGKDINIGETISFKEIIPTKLELTNNEMDLIHGAMKTGGIIMIQNYQLIKDSLIKLIDEIKDKNTIMNENFKLILVVKSNYLLPSYFYSSCYIINRDILLMEQMKDYLLDLIYSMPLELFNQVMNCENNNISAYYMKKLFIYFTIIHVILVQYSQIKSNIFKIPFYYNRKDYYGCLNYLIKYLTTISEEKQKELHNLDNYSCFTYESLIKIIIDIFITSRLITKEDYDNVNKFLNNLYENSFVLKDDYLFSYDDFIISNIDEKCYPITDQLNSKNENGNNNEEENNSLALQNIKYCIPKSALIEQFEKIPGEKYYILLYDISKQMINNVTDKILKKFYELLDNEKYEKNIFENMKNKLNINNVVERLNELKHSLPDLLNTTDANAVLFKVNKYNELFNPLDECLNFEINAYNNMITNLTEDINNLLNMIKSDMFLTSDYIEIIRDINLNKVPKKWKLSKNENYSKCKDLDIWLNQIKLKYNLFNTWIINGFLKIYDLSLFSNEKLFISLLPIYFHKKLTNINTTSDKIQINFRLTKYDSTNIKNDEISDEIIEEVKEANNHNEFIFIKGIRIKNFEGQRENEREIKSYKENINNHNGELLPIIVVTYTLRDYLIEQNDKKNNNKNINIIESEDEEEEEIIPDITKNESIVQSKIIIDEKEVEKRKSIMDKSSVRESVESAKIRKEVNVLTKTKVRCYKRHCRLDIPFVEKEDYDVYGNNEPYGYIEIRFICEKDKQEEYFVNKKIELILDK